eukprot:CAMPEP_0115042114 /NCGR_PEP_ID=MMETSP0216-20121206/46075_1 /TAXON_ID=223996 /ORGANISM="Protocruzia adherens, Strain Boccale" /LENGTH=89 /DNA_ID=CAMNT_0002424171 /DNA_START=33 /DNA_END=302 /DNA_ORIENTATION=+
MGTVVVNSPESLCDEVERSPGFSFKKFFRGLFRSEVRHCLYWKPIYRTAYEFWEDLSPTKSFLHEFDPIGRLTSARSCRGHHWEFLQGE